MTTYYVGPGGNDGNAGTSWATRKLTLNGAEDIPVAAGDLVYVAPGTYRETLTVDVSGSAGSPITYIGDYTGANTDGTGGVVRITGSDNDQTAARANAISATTKDYRTFRGFTLDTFSDNAIAVSGTDWIFDQLHISGWAIAKRAIYVSGAGQLRHTIKNCYIVGMSSTQHLCFEHSSAIDNCAHVVENCILFGSSLPVIGSGGVGGVTVRNCLIAYGTGEAVAVVYRNLTAGQVVTVNNCLIAYRSAGVKALSAGELVEDYNSFYIVTTARSNVSTGGNSNTYPLLWDARWFFEAVNGGNMVTPFDLASYSQLINVAGTSPTTADMRGTTVQGAQREWGPLEYDSTLSLDDDDGATYPAVGDVEAGVTFGAGGSLTGTFAVPAEADVESGVQYGAGGTEFTGTYDPLAAAVFPAEGNTLEAEAAYGPTGAEYAGTYHAPDVAEVIDTAVFGAASAEAGTVHLPDAAEVIDTAVFGPASATSGTFAIPDEGDVEAGVDYGAAAEYTGTFVVPAAEDVEAGVQYGADGTEFTGTLAGGGGDPDEIAAAVLAAMNLTPPAVNVTLWKDETAPDAPPSKAELDAGLLALQGADGDTLETLSDQIDDVATAADVWAYATRTLTEGSTSTTDVTASGSITRKRGNSWSISLALGSIASYTSLWFTIKRSYDDADSASLLQVKLNSPSANDGMLYVNGAAASNAALGSITVSDANTGAIVIAVDETITDDLAPGTYYYDCQMLNTGNVTTPDSGTFTITADVTRSVL